MVVLGALLIVDPLDVTEGELAPSSHATAVRDIGVPQSEAIRVAIIAAMQRAVVQWTVEIHFLSRVVAVDVAAHPLDIVCRVLNTVDAASNRVLCNADRVSQTPADQLALGRMVERSTIGHVVEVKRTDL